MYRLGVLVAVISVSASFALLGAAPVLAHGSRGVIQGMVIGVGHGTVLVQTQSGGVPLTVNRATCIYRRMSGSMVDVSGSEEIDAHLIPGTTTIDAIQIEPTAPTNPAERSAHARHAHSRANTAAHLKPVPHPIVPGNPQNVSGEVVTVGASIVTLRDRSGQTTNYSVSNSVTVTKIMKGSWKDLAVGEMVQIITYRGDAVSSITIMRA